MSQFGAKVVAFIAFGSLSGLGYMRYSKLSNYNRKAEELINNKQLQNYLFEAHEESSYVIDTIMGNYERTFNQSNINKYRETLANLAEGKTLEVCGGSNRNIKFYSPSIDLTLIDWSPKMVAVGMSKISPLIRFKYVIGDVRKMPFQDNSFDTVIDTFGLQYVIEPMKALSQIRRVCKKDGKIILMNQGLSSILQFHYYENFVWGEKLFNMGYFTNRNWQKIVKQFDFEIEAEQRKKNGKIYIYILKNSKQGKDPTLCQLS